MAGEAQGGIVKEMMVALMIFSGCSGDARDRDDAGIPINIYVPIGERCESGNGIVCGNGELGYCIDDTCKPQCTESVPRCRPPLIERHKALDGNTAICYCD